ncbi:MAG: hypothetical protein ACRES7_06670 [Gammaproteobacteria bacterium]
MDIIPILQGIKGKVLDAAHFEMLKHAYELQEENIRQLKNNNEALKESNILIREKLDKSEEDKVALEQALAAANAENDRLRPRDENEGQVSEVACAVLLLFKDADATNLYQEQIVKNLQYSRIQVESAIEELCSVNLLDFAGVHGNYGVNYYLTKEGKHWIGNPPIISGSQK